MPERSLSFSQLRPCRFSSSLYSQALLAAGKLTQFLPISILSFDWFQFLSVSWYIPVMPNAAEQVTVKLVLAVKTWNCISFCLSRASVKWDLSTCFQEELPIFSCFLHCLNSSGKQRSPLVVHFYFSMQSLFSEVEKLRLKRLVPLGRILAMWTERRDQSCRVMYREGHLVFSMRHLV